MEQYLIRKQDFDVHKKSELGCGRFSRVFKGKYKGNKVAVKVIATGGTGINLEEVLQEVKVMSLL